MSVSKESSQTTQQSKLTLPSVDTLNKCFKLSLKFTKPVDTYFYLDSCRDNVCFLDDGEDKVIFKNEDEHTSPILKIFLSDNEYIVMTENTIYVLNGKTPVRKINGDEYEKSSDLE
jgi:transposase